MSASLVGSEMCIRDSACTAVRGQGHRPSSGQTKRTSGRTCAAGATGRPVSYTHLTLPTICSV
eukprot:7116600-Alexandrium_andersonii.AAC.1